MNNQWNEWKHFFGIIPRIIPGCLNMLVSARYPYEGRSLEVSPSRLTVDRKNVLSPAKRLGPPFSYYGTEAKFEKGGIFGIDNLTG
jgi:hypothetical protein